MVGLGKEEVMKELLKKANEINDSMKEKGSYIHVDLSTIVNNWPTKYETGFLQSEIDEMLVWFGELNMDKWNSAMMGNTCMMAQEGIINYHCDVLSALTCALENRDQTLEEWD